MQKAGAPLERGERQFKRCECRTAFNYLFFSLTSSETVQPAGRLIHPFVLDLNISLTVGWFIM